MSELTKLTTVFDISYGNRFDLNKMIIRDVLDENSVYFVSRSSKNLGVSAIVEIIPDVGPFPPGSITVTLGGSYLLSSFVQTEKFYTAQNIVVLTPKKDMSFQEKLFYCICIRKNRFRYSAFGREANRTLRDIEVPASIPSWVYSISSQHTPIPTEPYKPQEMLLSDRNWAWFEYHKLFDIKKGKRIVNSQMKEGNTPCIRPISVNNGVYKFIDIEPNHDQNVITVNYNGSVGEAFYQSKPIFALDDINVLYPKFKLTPYIAMFLVTLIRKEQYRFNYGRKWHLDRMNESLIKLPVGNDGEPDWQFMEDYIKSLPYSKGLK